MNSRVLHIISFDIPYPPNYGGIVDVYYKILELRKQGIDIILHCFYKNLSDTKHLQSICKEVHLYERKAFNIFNFLPFIVSSRMDRRLIKQLNKDSHPILVEGIHCTGFLTKISKENRTIALRTHNIEHNYYRDLKKFDNNVLKKLYYAVESKRLLRYEKKISDKLNYIFPLSQKDVLYFTDIFKNTPILYTSAFYNASADVKSPQNYHLLQGNFDVEENKEAAQFLIKELAPLAQEEHFVIAGKNASKIKEALPKNVEIICSPSITSMTKLNLEAKTSIVYSNLNAGVKLKILNALAAGVPVYCNDELYLDPYLKNCLATYKNAKDLAKQLQNIDPTLESRQSIQNQFLSVFNLEHFAQQIIEPLFPEQV